MLLGAGRLKDSPTLSLSLENVGGNQFHSVDSDSFPRPKQMAESIHSTLSDSGPFYILHLICVFSCSSSASVVTGEHICFWPKTLVLQF